MWLMSSGLHYLLIVSKKQGAILKINNQRHRDSDMIASRHDK
jgi:hypothetical protein